MASGSSPHTRGLRRRVPRKRAEDRIIPAHAGFTRAGEPPGPSAGDHPRTRGVYLIDYTNRQAQAGSSPHTRGLPRRILMCMDAQRIIPAHAGFTCCCPTGRCSSRDHPRTRGVYGDHGVEHVPQAGSSPHTRGLRVAGWSARRACWIIPAHAGFTASIDAKAAQLGDHPRTRGVYTCVSPL